MSLVLAGMLTCLLLMTAAWAASLVATNAGIVDRMWGAMVAVLAWVYVGLGPAVTARSLLVASLATAWGVRLSGYLWWRDRGRGEDWRYSETRRHTPRCFALRTLVGVYWAHGLAAVGVGTPLLAVVRAGQPSLGWADAIGVGVWIAGFVFEAVGDHQLHRFRASADRTGPVMDTGLWRYTRHPNYFGDAVQWWGLGILGLAAGAWWAPIGPAVMTLVLLRLSGVTAMETHLQETIGAPYNRYVARTNSFVPGPPRPQ